MYFLQENKHPKKKKIQTAPAGQWGRSGRWAEEERGGRGGRGGWYRRGFVKTRRAHGLGLFFFFPPFLPFLPNQLKRETPPEAAAFRIHLKSSVDSAPGSVGAANANQVYNHQHGREKKEEKKIIFKFSSATHTQTDVRTHIHRHTKGRRGWGDRRPSEGGKCLQNARLGLSARGPSARGRRAGSAARPERHDGRRGSEPIFWRGSCNDAIPRPRVPAARPSPCLFFAFL